MPERVQAGLETEPIERTQMVSAFVSTKFDKSGSANRFKFSELDRAFHMMETKEDGIIKPLILFSAVRHVERTAVLREA